MPYDAGMGRLFGTDGVRGVAGRDLTEDLARALGRAGVAALRAGDHPAVVIGRDTRISGEALEAALAEGIVEAGGHAVLAGIVPTPAVAFLTVDLGAAAGVMVSASHNPPEYNGIKFFSSDGMKLPDDTEDRIEALLGADTSTAPGSVRHAEDDASERYLAHLVAAAEGRLEGMRVVVDCANGAAFRLAPEMLRRLGAEVTAINDEPDGGRINVGSGSTNPEVVARAVRAQGADAGVAHDGDADRAILVDAEGRVVDGDQLLAASALSLQAAGRLAKDTVVTTVMANLGFRRAMEEAAIIVAETRVGDRYVLEEMLRTGAVLGGEQSGHVIFLGHATTGDGLLTAARVLALARARGSLAEVASCMRRYPQVLEGVRVGDRVGLDNAEAVWEAVRRAEAALGERGRVLVRASGTEPLVRVMVEAETEEEAQRHTRAISETVASALGAS